MHQNHSIPWQTISHHLKIQQENPFLEGRNGTNIFRTAISTNSRQLPQECNEMNHFKRTLLQSMNEVSRTERAKYPSHPTFPSQGKVFSNKFLGNRPPLGLPDIESINQRTQKVESWLKDVPRSLTAQDAYGRAEDYTNAIKILLAKKEGLISLLILAKHPSCNPAALYSFGQSFDFGWGQVIDLTLIFYIFLNIVGNTPRLVVNSNYTRLRLFQQTIVYQLQRGGTAETELHRRYWESKLKPADPLYGKEGPVGHFQTMTIEFFEDMKYLKEYLKECWRLLYFADVLMKECAIDPEWDARVVRTLGYWGFRG